MLIKKIFLKIEKRIEKMHQKKLISKKSPKCSLIVRLSFTWQKHINAENTFIRACLELYKKILFI
jgi:hypothetical protein